MYVRNKTSQWRGKLSKEKLEKVHDFAKNAKSKEKALYFKKKKKKKFLKKKTMKLKQGMKEKGKKEKSDTEENKRLLRTSGQVALSTKTSDLVSNIYL